VANKALRAPGQTARGGEPTIAQITSSAAQFGITLSRLQPESDGSVSVAVEQQSFNALVQWLAGIESEQGYDIDRASIDRASDEGLVNGQFRFR
jgi:type II secretory pathway component PulM